MFTEATIHIARRLVVAAVILSCGTVRAQNSYPPASSGTPSAIVFVTRLKHSLKAERLRAGDTVDFVSVQSTLIPGPTVIPAEAVFHGTVLSATSVKEESGLESRVSIMVSSVTWKDTSLPLCATVAGFGRRTIKVMPPERPAHPVPAAVMGEPVTEQWQNGTIPTRGFSASPLSEMDRFASLRVPAPVLVMHLDEFVRDISIFRTPSGASELVRERKKLHLPSGMLVTLRPAEGCSF